MPEDFVVELQRRLMTPQAGQVGEIGRPVIGRQSRGPHPYTTRQLAADRPDRAPSPVRVTGRVLWDARLPAGGLASGCPAGGSATGMSVWLRDHADRHLAVLMSAYGPSANPKTPPSMATRWPTPRRRRAYSHGARTHHRGLRTRPVSRAATIASGSTSRAP